MLQLGDTCLRAVERRDLPVTRVLRVDAAIARGTLGRRFPITEANEEAWFDGLGRGAFPDAAVWAIAAVEGAQSIVGIVQIAEIDWVHRTGWFGIWVAPDQQGQGHGRRATTLACAHAGHDLGLRQLRLRVLADNAAAIGVYHDAGYVDEGTQVAAVIIDGEPRDLVIMRLDLEGAPA